ncbi:MAG: hypothetical protein IJ748_00240 [Bacteroidales bacterium]|nr:hypothetical protein [Bacteroidales bacterium]
MKILSKKYNFSLKAAVLTFAVLIGLSTFANPPRPSQRPSSKADGINKASSPDEGTGAVGTATALLLTLSAGTLVYNIKKNKRKQEED